MGPEGTRRVPSPVSESPANLPQKSRTVAVRFHGIFITFDRQKWVFFYFSFGTRPEFRLGRAQ
jgi:hypothetical protein